MKKKITVTIVAVIAGLTIFVGGVYAGATYIQWAGTPNYEQALEHINQYSERGQEIIGERDQAQVSLEETIIDRDSAQRENEQLNNAIGDLENTILDKDNHIDSLNQDIKALEERVEGGKTTQGQLEQAEKDMQHIEQRSQEVLEELEGE